MDFLSELIKTAGSNNVFTNEPMSVHTTFKAGGPAKYFVLPRNRECIIECIRLSVKYGKEYVVLGKGSNVLISDSGYDGMIIYLGRSYEGIEVSENIITAEAGTSLAAIYRAARDNSLKGFEFAAGIPGSLGGACFMNAGAYGGEMKDILEEVTAMDGNGTIHTYCTKDMDLGYRKSIFQTNNEIILSAVLRLEKGDINEITAKAAEYAQRRRDKQPLEYPSAGSTFKRPEGYFAGELIEKAGLKGCGRGGAEVSLKHAGFVINKNNATAEDIFKTIMMVIDRVKDNSGIILEPEVRLIGNFQNCLD